MSKKITLWIARDADDKKELYLFETKPEYDTNEKIFVSHCNKACELDSRMFPEINEGECYEATLKLGEKLEVKG